MTLSLTHLLLVGGGLAAPWLLEEGAARGLVLVPPYVTAGQRAAVRAVAGEVLGAPVVELSAAERRAGVDQRVTYHLLRVLRRLRQLRGAAVGEAAGANLAAITAADGQRLAAAFLAAVRAGVEAPAEPYQLVRYTGLGAEEVARGAWAAVVGLELADADLTSLGRAVALVERHRIRAENVGNPLAERFDPNQLQRAVVRMVAEADALGYRVTGEPAREEPIGPLAALQESVSWVGDQVGDGVGWVAGKAAGLVGGAIAGVVFSTPGLLAAGGLLAWRLSR